MNGVDEHCQACDPGPGGVIETDDMRRCLACGRDLTIPLQTIHELKTHPRPYAEIVSGIKTYEIRRFDRDYKLDDILRLREWIPHELTCAPCMASAGLEEFDPTKCPGGDYTGRVIIRQIRHITPPGSVWLAGVGLNNVGILGIR